MEIIHIVLGKANPDRMNGVNKVVHQLASKQSTSGRKVSVWGFTRNPVHDYPSRNFQTVLFRSYRNPFRVDPAFRKLISTMNGKAVFHIHGGFNPLFFSVSRLLVKADKPYIMTPHGAYNSIALHKNRTVKWIYRILFESYLVKHARLVHCLGESERTGTARLFGMKPCSVIPYGIDPALNLLLDFPRDKNILCFCGRLDMYTKGLDAVLKAFAMLVTIRPELKLWILGDGQDRKQLQEMSDRLGLQSVTFWGSVYGQEKDRLLSQAGLFIHPSRNEGLPAAILESLAMGLPVVVTRATNLGDQVEKYGCGRVIEETDAPELSRAIMDILFVMDKSGVSAFHEASVSMIRHRFNWDRVLQEFDNMYQKDEK